MPTTRKEVLERLRKAFPQATVRSFDYDNCALVKIGDWQRTRPYGQLTQIADVDLFIEQIRHELKASKRHAS
jgi:hypothetical protein